jgi:soluble lytic murein transglycosylase-like protein
MTMFIFFFCALLLAGVPLLAAAPQAASATMKPGQALEEALKQQGESIQKQRQAIRRQLGEKGAVDGNTAVQFGVQFIDPLPALSPVACPALEQGKVSGLVAAAAQRHSLDPALLTAVIKQESAFNPCAVSLKGALGLMQLMPETARELHVADVFDPEENIRGGAAYLRQLLDRYKGDLRLALIGYNAGPGRADQPPAAPYPVETQNYVASILADLGIGPMEGAPLTDEGVRAQEADADAPAVAAASDSRPSAEATKPQRLKPRPYPL